MYCDWKHAFVSGNTYSAINAEMYTNKRELLAICSLFGVAGVTFFSKRILSQCVHYLNALKDTSLMYTDILAGNIMEVMVKDTEPLKKVSKSFKESMAKAVQLGSLLALREDLIEALKTVIF